MKDEKLYLIHIEESVTLIENFVTGGEAEFYSNKLVSSAVLYSLQTLAESTQHLTTETKAKYPDIPWNKIRGLRNILVHGYMDVKLEIVWDIIQNDLPILKSAMQELLQPPPTGNP